MVNKLFGKKLGMTRFFLDEGKSVPVSVLKLGPCVVIQKKTNKKEGYNAIQVGFGTQKESRGNKPLLGHFKSAGKGRFAHLGKSRSRIRIVLNSARKSNQTSLMSAM
jgi:large subunit ribosomal protein L3